MGCLTVQHAGPVIGPDTSQVEIITALLTGTKRNFCGFHIPAAVLLEIGLRIRDAGADVSEGLPNLPEPPAGFIPPVGIAGFVLGRLE